MLNGKPYCRKCISFRGEEVEHKASYPKKAPIHLEYELSPEQKELSDKLVENYKKGIDSLVFAVCGSGKTEITIGVIKLCMERGLTVGFALPRRDVAKELFDRFTQIFKNNHLALVYGGHNKYLKGDLVILTTHQLFRYDNYFDLLIVDEMDAFPFKGSDVLVSFFRKAIKKNYILMSATPEKSFVEKFQKEGGEVLHLFMRFHRHPLPVPKIIIKKSIFIYIELIKKVKYFMNKNKPLFIFTPTIAMCESIYKLLSIFIKGGNYVHSKKHDRPEVIEAFRKGRYQYLVTTAVLERGVTVKDLQVIIFRADNSIYDEYSLVQIAGRVGRKKEAPEGEVIYLANEYTKDMEKSIKSIQNANESLQNML